MSTHLEAAATDFTLKSHNPIISNSGQEEFANSLQLSAAGGANPKSDPRICAQG